jgi:hypothetical protein
MIPHDREIDHGPELFLGFAGAHRGARAGRAFSPRSGQAFSGQRELRRQAS